MYQNFDEKYVTINYDEGSSATLTQTTLAYWDKDYGKKLLTSDEQLNMYLKPTITPVIKYLMYDNMCKLVDAGAFIKCEKLEDALSNYKYNFYTKRNVRYTILFPVQFHNINSIYLENFEKLYRRQLEIFEQKEKEQKELEKKPGVKESVKTIEEKQEEIKQEIKEEIKQEISVVETFDLGTYGDNFVEEIKEEKEIIKEEIKEAQKEEKIKVENITLPRKTSKVIFNEETKIDEKKEEKVEIKPVKKEDLSSILSSLDLD